MNTKSPYRISEAPEVKVTSEYLEFVKLLLLGFLEIGFYVKRTFLKIFNLEVVSWVSKSLLVCCFDIVIGQLLMVPVYFGCNLHLSTSEYLQFSVFAGIFVIMLGYGVFLLGEDRKFRLERERNL